MAKVYCDECVYIGESYSAMLPPITCEQYTINHSVSEAILNLIELIVEEDDIHFSEFNTVWMDYDYYKLK